MRVENLYKAQEENNHKQHFTRNLKRNKNEQSEQKTFAEILKQKILKG